MAKPKTKTSDESAEIIVNEQGVPVIAGTDFKVRQIAMDYIEMGYDVAGIQGQHPFLSKAQIRLAISYYLNNLSSDKWWLARVPSHCRRDVGKAFLVARCKQSDRR